MPRTVRTEHNYPVAPERLWAVVTSLDGLKHVMKGLVTFRPLPGGQITKGQVIETNISLFGVLPAFPYCLEVVECDPEVMHARTVEKGGGIDQWEHAIDVEATESGSLLKDAITIDAGWRTPIVAAWAKYMLKRRHKPRLEILGLA